MFHGSSHEAVGCHVSSVSQELRPIREGPTTAVDEDESRERPFALTGEVEVEFQVAGKLDRRDDPVRRIPRARILCWPD
jgi:hypothetical protein